MKADIETIPAITQPYLSWGGPDLWPYVDYSGIDDATLIWWDPTATGPDEIRRDGTGMWQYADGGARFLPGAWPTDSHLFDAGVIGHDLRGTSAGGGPARLSEPGGLIPERGPRARARRASRRGGPRRRRS